VPPGTSLPVSSTGSQSWQEVEQWVTSLVKQ
jgi:hypothetical protein